MEYRVTSAKFLLSAPDLECVPDARFPEAVFLGRSNVGKSSLLNALCNTHSLARVSRTPGRTQAFNYFEISFVDSAPIKEERLKYQAYFVDLPGYGFAKVEKSKKRNWLEMIDQYLLRRETLTRVCLLIDCRRGPEEEELSIARLGKAEGLIVALTKADKLSRSEQQKAKSAVEKQLRLPKDQVHLVSTLKPEKEGSFELFRQTLLRGLAES